MANQRLEDYQNGLERDSQYYQDLLKNEKKSFDPNSEYYKKKSVKEKVEESEIGLSASFNWNVLSYWQPWYPEIEDKSFAVNSVWDKEKQKYTFTAEYTIFKSGFFAGTGLGITPCLRLKDSGDDNAKRHYVWPEEGGKSARLQEGKTYHFNLEDRNDNIVYEIAPCYFQHPFSDASTPLAVDKEEKRCLATPKMIIQDVEVMQYKCTKDPVGSDDQYYDENGKYEYEYKWMLSTITTIKGIPYMSNWVIYEALNRKEYNKRICEMKDEDSYVKLKNDRYEMYWTIFKYSHKYEENKRLEVSFVPVYCLKEDRSQIEHYCEERECVLEGGVLKSRAAIGVNQASRAFVTADGDKVICRLDTIMKDGQVIWQREDHRTELALFPQPQWKFFN
jgi:hypothetical protein